MKQDEEFYFEKLSSCGVLFQEDLQVPPAWKGAYSVCVLIQCLDTDISAISLQTGGHTHTHTRCSVSAPDSDPPGQMCVCVTLYVCVLCACLR